MKNNVPEEIVAYYQDDGNVNTISIDSIDIDALKDEFEVVGAYYSKEDDTALAVFRTNAFFTKDGALVIAFLGYILIVFGLGLFYDEGHFFQFRNISLQSFLTHVLVIPLGVLAIIAGIDLYLEFFHNTAIEGGAFIIYGIAQSICLGVWFGYHLLPKNETTISQVNYLKLDLYSTIAVVVLTFVWVIYDITDIKVFFGVVLVEFMLVQVRIKTLQIREVQR